jgi:hypothetical protein
MAAPKILSEILRDYDTGFVGGLFLISSRTGHGSSKVFEMLPDFSCISWACVLRGGGGGDASIFFSGPAEAEEGHSLSVSAGSFFRNIMARLLFGAADSESSPRWL